MDLRPGIKVDKPFFVAFSEHYTLSFIEVDVITVERDHLANTHPRGREKINNSQISCRSAAIPHLLQRLIRISVLDNLSCFDFVNPANRAFHNKVFIFQPREETGQNAPDIIYRDFAGFPLDLIARQVLAEIIASIVFR